MKRIIVWFMALSFLAAAGIGIYYRQSYTDIRKLENPMQDFGVAPMQYQSLEATIQRMEAELGDSKHICLVKALGDIQYDFKIRKQLVEIEEIYKGNEISAGDKIYITQHSLITYFDDMTMNMSFVNHMQKGKEYLAFFEDEIHSPQKEDYKVFVCSDYMILPVFALEKMEEKIPKIAEDVLYVPYEEIAGNEFFFRDKVSFEIMNKFKEKLLKTYIDK